MIMSPKPHFATLAAAVALAAGLAFSGANVANAEDDDSSSAGPCTAKKFTFPVVQKACKEGGRKKVRELMQELKKRANEKGIKIKDASVGCRSCHVDQKAKYELKDNAVADLKKMLAIGAPVPAPKSTAPKSK